MRRLVLLACFFLMVLSLGGSDVTAQGRVRPIALVPSSSVAVIKVNWAAVRGDDRLRALVKGDEFERVLDKLGINSRDVSELIVFTGLNASSNGSLAMIFSGSYRPQNVISQLKSQGWTEQLYKAHKVYLNPADNSSIAPLRSGLFVAGSKTGVEKVIDVELKPQSGLALKPPFSSALSRFTSSRHPISFMMGIPPDYENAVEVIAKVASVLISFPGSGPLGIVMSKIGFPRMLGFSITRNGSSFPVELLAMMKDDTSASIVSGAFNLAQSLNLSLLSKRTAQSNGDPLKSISITRDGALLSIKMVMREGDLPR